MWIKCLILSFLSIYFKSQCMPSKSHKNLPRQKKKPTLAKYFYKKYKLLTIFSIFCNLIKILMSSMVLQLIPLTWVSERLRAAASSTLSGVDKYLWASNLFSRPVNCWSEKTVLALRRLQCLEPGSPVNSEPNGMPKSQQFKEFLDRFRARTQSSCILKIESA